MSKPKKEKNAQPAEEFQGVTKEEFAQYQKDRFAQYSENRAKLNEFAFKTSERYDQWIQTVPLRQNYGSIVPADSVLAHLSNPKTPGKLRNPAPHGLCSRGML